MALPKLDIPTFTTKLLSNGKKITYRPFLVKEEKILFMALESDSSVEMTRAMKQIINNCVQDDIDIDDLPLFDIEYLMVNLRSKSVGENAEVIYSCRVTHNDEICGNRIPIKIDLEKITLNNSVSKTPESIMLSENIGIQMRYPKTEMLATPTESDDALSTLWNTLELCIDFIFDDENVYRLEDYTYEEKQEFFESLTQDQFGNIREFFDSLPKLQYKDNYSCNKCGHKGELLIEGVDSFFV
tara:strand:+ start:1244 stop:1969 length:726 start_codon:yes stop_codon:yes gene_type:complete